MKANKNTLEKAFEYIQRGQQKDAPHSNDVPLDYPSYILYLFKETDVNPINAVNTFEMEFTVPQLDDLGADVFEHIYYEDTGLPDTCDSTATHFSRTMYEHTDHDYPPSTIKTKQQFVDLVDILTYVIESGEFDGETEEQAEQVRNVLYERVIEYVPEQP